MPICHFPKVISALLIVTAAVVISLTNAADSVGYVGPQASPMSAEPKPRIWVVVNLFTGQSSKQAVLVRDTLARLGAKGRGIVLPYKDITVDNMQRLDPAFLALSPNGIPWCRYKGRNGENLQMFFKSLKILIEQYNVPVVGICGGHQALALAFGGKVGPIRGGEDDCFPYGKNPTERGRHYVDVVKEDPIFLGMSRRINLVENHYDEVKRLPSGFVCLARNELCPYQIIRHPSKPAYGLQAHSEYYFSSRPDGGLLLRNFLAIAENHNRFYRDVEPVDPGPTAANITPVPANQAQAQANPSPGASAPRHGPTQAKEREPLLKSVW